MFNCDKCGLCCQNLNKSINADDLNDGTGVCVYYNKKVNYVLYITIDRLNVMLIICTENIFLNI